MSSGPPPPPKPDPITEAMMVAAQNPEAAQAAAKAGVSAVQGAERAGGGDMKAGAKVMTGAAVVAGTAVGVVAGSTMLGLAAAGGAAYAATRSDKIGDAAKSTGKAAVAVGAKAAEVNRQHHITERIGAATKKSISAAQGFDKKHDVTGKIAGTITSAATGLTKALQKKQSSEVPTQATPPAPPLEGHQGVCQPSGPTAVREGVQRPAPPPPPPPPEGHEGVYPPKAHPPVQVD